MKKPPKALVLVSLLATGACYTYKPTPVGQIVPGTDVHVHLDSAEDVELSSVTVRDVTTVKGQLTRWTANEDAVIFSTSLLTRPGVTQTTVGELVTVPGSNIAGVDAPVFSGVKTGVIVALGVGVAVGLIAAIASQGNKGDGGPGEPGTDPGEGSFIRIPISIGR